MPNEPALIRPSPISFQDLRRRSIKIESAPICLDVIARQVATNEHRTCTRSFLPPQRTQPGGVRSDVASQLFESLRRSRATARAQQERSGTWHYRAPPLRADGGVGFRPGTRTGCSSSPVRDRRATFAELGHAVPVRIEAQHAPAGGIAPWRCKPCDSNRSARRESDCVRVDAGSAIVWTGRAESRGILLQILLANQDSQCQRLVGSDDGRRCKANAELAYRRNGRRSARANLSIDRWEFC